ncbi:tyrosine-type recombinase/integrase [Mycolicibacterium brisbanense]|uniref:Phage integrase family protein n=1 Tax=Mycolicibacterium brisbanense TaxID=146020 RepID=A0A100W4S0_9MYCO|nr:site-specific integrase [Mycolicibacterium brisbanense]MCV7157421.1 site-specific integrase [Mycolicibacterium brisbanense]GAS91536.1 phage integrase family protein [Mycolicibacterium brisbanense]
MATIRKRTTKKLDKFGNPVVSYQVRWNEPVRDEFGAPTGQYKETSETFPTERKAKAHLRKVEDQLDSAAGVDPSSQKAKANRPLGEYAKQYLDSLVGTIDDDTIQGYANTYRRHIAGVFGQRPVASITTADVARFRADLLAPHEERDYVTRGTASPATASKKRATVTRSPKTVKHIIGTLKRMLDVAVDDQAIPSNPVVPGRRHSTKRRVVANGKAPFKHRPLSSGEVAAVHDYIAEQRGNPVYALVVVFAAYTGVRVAELQGLQIQDLTLSDIPGTVGSVRVVRTLKKGRPTPNHDGNAVNESVSTTLRWIEGTPKSDASTDRTIPLAPWLADDMRAYLSQMHPFSGIGSSSKRIDHAPLFPGKRTRAGKAEVSAQDFDWAKPLVVDNVYHNYFQPATKALGLGNVRFYDLRHTFATLALSAGEHYMQVSKWLGHSSYVLTLTTYADYIREDDTAAPNLPRPVAQAAKAARNIVPLHRKAR